MAGTIPTRMLIGLLLALIVNRRFRGRGVVRTVLYFPYIAPLVSVAVLL
jgi:ABC-type sugar transport system permease subunit